MDCTNIIGEKIKSLRTNQEISIQELAERAGLTVEQVSRIEENIDIPSLAPLIKIARALGVRLGTFLDDQTSEAGPVICRKGEADDTIGFSNNATHAASTCIIIHCQKARWTVTWNRSSSTSTPTTKKTSFCRHMKEKSLSWY